MGQGGGKGHGDLSCRLEAFGLDVGGVGLGVWRGGCIGRKNRGRTKWGGAE